MKREKELQLLNTGFCRVCGLAYRLHAILSDPVKGEWPQNTTKWTDPRNNSLSGIGDGFICHVVATEWQMKRIPILNLNRLLPMSARRRDAAPPVPSTMAIVPVNTAPPPSTVSPNSTWESRVPTLLTASDPKFISATRALISALKLPSFDIRRPAPAPGLPAFPIDPAVSPAEIQADVAPFAMISLLTKQFARTLIKSAVEASNSDRLRAMKQVDSRIRRQPNVVQLFSERERRMLLPSHVIRGVSVRGWNWKDELGMAMLGCLTRSGVPLQQHHPGPVAGLANASGLQNIRGEQEILVKTNHGAHKPDDIMK
jgi:hypothetical protein